MKFYLFNFFKANFQFQLGIILCLFFISCEKKEPPYALTNDQFVLILTDLHISESATQHLGLSMRDSMVKVYLDQVLTIHEVPIEVFEPAFQRLKHDPEKLQQVYDKVIKRLNELKLDKKKNEKEKAKEENVKESLEK